MIKTNSYNDFSSYDYKQISNEAFMFSEFEEFIKNGGNLNLGVNLSSSDIKVIPFEEFIREKFSVSFFDKLVGHQMVDSPFDFILDKSKNTIKEHSSYGLDWMRKNFETYENQILKSIEKICESLKNTTNASYENESYLKINRFQNALFFIAEKLEHKAKVWDILLDKNNEVKEYLKQDKKFLNIIGPRYSRNNDRIKTVFYKHGILNEYFKENAKELHSLVKNCIYNNEINLINKLSKQFNLKEIEKEEKYYECFLKSAGTSEIATKLLDNDCFLYGKWTGKKTIHDTNDKIVHAFDENMNPEILDAILNHSQTPKDFVSDNPDLIFDTFFKNKTNYPSMQFLIENNQFPIENYDFFEIAYYLKNRSILATETEPIKWFMSHGADPRNCSKFIPAIVSARDEGLKTLKKHAKEGILDPYSADITFEMLSQNVTKIFITYYEKLTSAQLGKHTKNGKPAWWGCTDDSFFNSIKRKIENFNQLSLDKKSWIFEVVERDNEKNHNSNFKQISFAYDKIKGKSIKFSANGHDPESNNILHHLLKIKEYKKPKVDEKFVEFVFQSSEANWAELINQKNNAGKYPLEDFLYIEKNDKIILNTQSDFVLKFLIEQLGADFPFEQKINNQILLEYLKENCDEEIYQKSYEYYQSKLFAEKIDLKLENKKENSKAKKI